MTTNLDIWKALWDSTLIVKLVLLCLLFSSIMSWAVILKKRAELKATKDLNLQFMDAYKISSNLNELFKKSKDMQISPYSLMFQHGYEEFLKISDKMGGSKSREQLLEHFSRFGLGLIERALKQGVNESNERMQLSLPVLASVGSISPFVGLFGTVWGIIHAFSGLSGQGASLETVAPGIAEALVATAIGLLAAIPAVLFYNHFAAEIEKINLNMENFGQEFLNVVERSLVAKV